METYSKDIVKKLLDRTVEKVSKEKDARIKMLETELEAIKLEKELNKDYNVQPQKEDVVDIDKILGGFND